MLQHQLFRMPAPGQPLVLAAFSFRYDAHLVPDLLENIRPAIHGYVVWDDRAAETALSDEPTRRTRPVTAARALGADWLLAPDPDERFEAGFPAALPALLAEGDRNLWLFTLREMFSHTQYRTDGLWGAKSVLRLLPIAAAGTDPAQTLHGSWIADESGLHRRNSRLNLYHLRMASPLRRQLRRDLYAAADPDRRFQALGYDYLPDDRGMVLEALPQGRTFTPPFVEDHGLWSPDPGTLGTIQPDPYKVRLARAASSARRRGKLAAHHVLRDLCEHSPDDADLPLTAARLAFEGGAPDLALNLPADSLGARFLRASALVATGELAAAQTDLRPLQSAAPGSPILAALAEDAARPTANLAAADAPWRYLASGATIHEGTQIVASDLAVTVIGFQNQPGLLQAVQSLLAQDPVPEIVVVNSGGGDVAARLAPVLDHIRLITTNQPLYVGAARNIGVAASRAPYLAFLAGDCLARPGWVSGRLARHFAGAGAVATAVVGEGGATLVALAATRLRYASRHPDANPRHLSFYGQSYARTLLRQLGQFPPGLRVGEDTALNRTLAKLTTPVWAPDVQTTHRDVRTLAAQIADERTRGQRRAAHPPFRALAGADDAVEGVARVLNQRLSVAHDLLALEPGLTDAERRALLATQWLATRADQNGTLQGMAQIARADALAENAKAAADPGFARQACALYPQDAEKAVLLADLLRKTGDVVGARAAYAAALALDPKQIVAAEGLIALVSAMDGPEAAWQLAEALVCAAPTFRHLWSITAQAALAAGHPAWAVALAQVALVRGVDAASTHALLARLHNSAGDPVAADYRALTARRLQASG